MEKCGKILSEFYGIIFLKTIGFLTRTQTKIQISCHKHKLNPILVHYIYHKNEKGKTCQMDLPLLKNDITNNLESQKPVIYSRYMQTAITKKAGPLLTLPIFD